MALLGLATASVSCAEPVGRMRAQPETETAPVAPENGMREETAMAQKDERWAPMREAMVRLIRQRGIEDERLLAAMRAVRRHRYIPDEFRSDRAYGDHPLPIGHGQTISQPYIVAYMTDVLKVQPGEKVLEIGTGSGYQAAVLAAMDAKVYTIEIVPELAEHAKTVLKAEGFEEVAVRAGDGYQGWPEHAPFDAIIVTCAPENVPKALVEQLKDGGRMIVPVGVGTQRLVILRKQDGRIRKTADLPVRFVPMVKGEQRER